MSDYLYNILVRSFGLIETAQPRLSSVFEPSSDFRPIDAPENYAPTEDRSLGFGESERVSPASSARPSGTAPSQTPQRAARDDSPTTAGASSSRPRSSSMEGSAAGRQEETEPHTERRPIPSASIIKEEPIVTRAAHGSGLARTAQTGERAMIEPLDRADENLSVASPNKQSQAKAGTIDETPRPQRIVERTHLVDRVTEQRIVGAAVAKESQPSSLNKESSSAEQHPHSSSQRMKVAASGPVAAFAVPPQQTAASSLPVVTERGDKERRETVIAQPQVSRYVEMQRPESLQKPRPPEPEQIIQVTIGRVEVRASSTPAAQGKAQPKAARQPSQSLEEYLRRRGRGGGGGGGGR